MEGAKHDETQASAISSIANSYLYAGDYKSAMNYLAEQIAKLDSSHETQGRIMSEKMNCLSNSASIAIHSGDAAKLRELVAALEPISIQTGNDVGTEEAKLTQKANMLFYKSMLAAIEGNYDAAKLKAGEIKASLASVKDPNKLDQYEFALGFIAMKQKYYSEAVTHFGKTLQSSVYSKYWNAMANEAAGNTKKANSLFKEVSTYNFNDIGYALIRSEVLKKVATL
jgi:tetratricopeptide (TPR) repeat protein